MKKKPKISVIIPSYDSSKTIAECLRAVYDSDFKDFEVIVVDDCSTDNTASIVKKFPCKLISLKKNSGPAKARNTGAENAKGDILFFIDSDVIIFKNSLKEVYDSYRNKDIVAVIGMYSKHPVNHGFFQEYMALWKHYTWTFPKPPKYFSFFIASCGSIKKQLFNELKGFNTNYKGADVEDYEFGHRINKRYRINFNPKLQGKHYHPDLKSCAKNYYKRASQWFKLFVKRKKFDTGAASASRGVSSIIALTSLLFFILSLAHSSILIIALPLLIIFIFMNIRFYFFTFNEKNTTFMLRAIITNYILAVAISLGVVKSIIKYPFEK